MENSLAISYRKNYNLSSISIAIIVFIASFLFAPFYFSGDQMFYRITFENMIGRNLIEAYLVYPVYTSSKEFVHFFVIWLTSNCGFEKDIVMGFANGLLAYYLMKLFEKWEVSLIVASSICITNFYLIVLYFAAERLKFGVLFFVMSVYYSQNNNKNASLMLGFLAVASHVQILIPYSSILFSRFISSHFLKSLLRYKLVYRGVMGPVFVFIIGVTLIWHFLGYQISSKFEYYVAAHNEKFNYYEHLQSIFVFSLTLIYTKNYIEVTSKFIPVFFAVYLIGGDNVNLFAFATFIYYAIAYKRGLNLGVLLLNAYFGFKSILFIWRIFETGQGF